MEPQVLAVDRVVSGQADLGIDDQVAELVPDDVEIEAERVALDRPA